MATAPWAILLVLFSTIPGACGPILVKKGSAALTRNFKKLITNYAMIVGFFLYGTSAIMFTIALRAGELSILYPLNSVGYIWVSLLSVKFLGEQMNGPKWLGIVAIVIGVSLIGLGS